MLVFLWPAFHMLIPYTLAQSSDSLKVAQLEQQLAATTGQMRLPILADLIESYTFTDENRAIALSWEALPAVSTFSL